MPLASSTVPCKRVLAMLQERQKWHKQQRNFAVDDIILVLDESKPRNFWPLAWILEVYPNRNDGLVRSVKLKAPLCMSDQSTRLYYWRQQLHQGRSSNCYEHLIISININASYVCRCSISFISVITFRPLLLLYW